MRKKEEMQEALFWKRERNAIRCELCAVRCFIKKDSFGACEVRKNVRNRLYTLNWKVTGLVFDNIEKRFMYHFYPESKCLAISGLGSEKWKIYYDKLPKNTKSFSPEDIVNLAEKHKAKIICFTQFEPAIFFEFIYRTCKLAYRNNIKTMISTNGLISEDAIKKISKYLDASLVNLKASLDEEITSKYTFLKNREFVLDVLKQMKKQRIHIEITNTIIPQVGESMEKFYDLVEWISNELSPSVPLHILQFHPDEIFPDLPFTPIQTLINFVEEARKSGLRYVYLGNVIEPNEYENTYCYNCREVLIERVAGNVKRNILKENRCPNCKIKIDIVI